MDPFLITQFEAGKKEVIVLKLLEDAGNLY